MAPGLSKDLSCRTLGWPRPGVLLDEANRPFSDCIRCNTCDGFPCLVHAKSDAEVIAVLATPTAATTAPTRSLGAEYSDARVA